MLKRKVWLLWVSTQLCKVMSYEILWTLENSIMHIWLSPFSWQWLVAGPVNGYISVYIYRLASIMSQACYWVTARFIFVCLLNASWGHWAGKCCYYCCLFCMLEQWLLQQHDWSSILLTSKTQSSTLTIKPWGQTNAFMLFSGVLSQKWTWQHDRISNLLSSRPLSSTLTIKPWVQRSKFMPFPRVWFKMKCKQPHLGFALRTLIPFPITITILSINHLQLLM